MAAVERKTGLISQDDLCRLRVAIVHYWFVSWRGGEKVIESILKLFPQADIYTLFYNEAKCESRLSKKTINSSCLDYPFIRRYYQKLFPFYPLRINSLRLKQNYDLIISSESGPAKGIQNPKGIPHLCYVHTPMRYCWGFVDSYLDSIPAWMRKLAEWRFRKLGEWDLTTVDNVDQYIANSKNVADRVKKYYGKEAGICYPPIALELFERDLKESTGHHYLSFGALTPYKNIRLLIETFNRLNKKLIVIGDGGEKKKLERMANSNIRFTGHLPLSEVLTHIQHARALLFPGEEDFGMIPLEVMSQGIPVIALKKGGALETVCENRKHPEESSGIFFDSPTVECLTEAIERFESIEKHFNRKWIRNHARNFGEDYFLKNMTARILDLLNKNISQNSVSL